MRLPARNGEFAPKDCRWLLLGSDTDSLRDVMPRVRPGVDAMSFTELLSTVRLRTFFWRCVPFSVALGDESSSSELENMGTWLWRGGDFFARLVDCLPGDLLGDGGNSAARWRALW